MLLNKSSLKGKTKQNCFSLSDTSKHFFSFARSKIMLVLHSPPHHKIPTRFPHSQVPFSPLSDIFSAMELQTTENRTSYKLFLSPNFLKLDSACLPRQPPSLKYFCTVWLFVI